MVQLQHLTLPLQRNNRFYCFPESAGYYRHYQGHEVRRAAGMLQEFNLHLVTAGVGYVELEQQRYELTAGDAFLYFPGDKQVYYADKERPWDFKWIHFYGSGILADLTERGFHRSIGWRIRSSSVLESLLDELLLEMDQHKMLHPSRISMLMYGIIAEFIEQAEPVSAPGAGASAIERMLKLLPELQAAATEPFDLDEWAARAGTNRYAFCRWFRRAAGQTPLEFVTMCRIQRAKQLLVERQSLSVQEIARLSGYMHHSYFNKRFQESENMTPTAYRQQFYMQSLVHTPDLGYNQ
ncbi:AraC family transcriptional regulator [Paenibacillus sp. OV219]|uniref:helix-turn-helix transcriptional regulator n=1 Tax=Paenibacillus sp. OV219 TaxID=1884377 RepID=UPI0008C8AE42|nr:helix-turn-helix domain-containing protein [Paenibacillus sp. OV219]SEN84779.1 AraC-like ligand binding domain-containing protein [Paenibacillus sp. OV219]